LYSMILYVTSYCILRLYTSKSTLLPYTTLFRSILANTGGQEITLLVNNRHRTRLHTRHTGRNQIDDGFNLIRLEIAGQINDYRSRRHLFIPPHKQSPVWNGKMNPGASNAGKGHDASGQLPLHRVGVPGVFHKLAGTE